MPVPVADRDALVTDGVTGIGRAAVERLLAQGARVAAVDLDGGLMAGAAG